MLKLIQISCFFMVMIFSVQAKSIESPATAFYYAINPPLDLLSAYERVILEPENTSAEQVQYLQQRGATAYAYLSIGEVAQQRTWFKEIQAQWKQGTNSDWNSAVMDMTATGWHDYLLNTRMKQLWQQGYRGFFLDTMDSYQLFAKTEAEQLKQQQGMVALLKSMKQQYPGISLLFNRGFEILDKAAGLADGIIAESLFAGWDPVKSVYRSVPENDREWLLGKLTQARDDYGLPVTVLDYLPPEQRDQAKRVAKKITLAGFTPWVSTPSLDYMGVGSKALIPRKVLFLYDSREGELPYSNIHRFLAMPLEYLGYIPDYWDINKALPDYILQGRYAGIALWLLGNNTSRDKRLGAWVYRQVQQHIPVAFLGEYTLAHHTQLNHFLSLDFHPKNLVPPIKLQVLSKHIGFEAQAKQQNIELPHIKTSTAQPWIKILGSQGESVDPVFISSWGGVALSPYILQEIPALGGDDEYIRWIINPFEFLKAALQLKDIPVPDATTENGNRILTLHLDGDGFYNKTELGGGRYSSELILDEFIKPFSLPHTVSIIEGEIGKAGLKPELSSALQAIAQDIFRLPNVEIASHTFSHPFDWEQAAKQSEQVDVSTKKSANILKGNETQVDVFKASEGEYHLPIPNYTYNVEREIKGSVNYIDKLLAPAGKKTQVFLWSGDCLPTEAALAWTKKIHLANMNGGDTVIRKGINSISNISSSGIVRGAYFQPYAPIQNENVYTNDWLGPYYGYQRVIETFQLTDKPKRFKPISIYYHFYSGDRLASVRALHRVYDWALAQETLPLWISEYTPRLSSFRSAVYEQLAEGWRIYGADNLRTLRLPEQRKQIDMSSSVGLVGYRSIEQGQYIALNGASTVSLQLTNQQKRVPYLIKSNARVQYWRKNKTGIDFRLKGHQPVTLNLANLEPDCVLKNKQGKKIMPSKREGKSVIFSFKKNDTGALQVSCG